MKSLITYLQTPISPPGLTVIVPSPLLVRSVALMTLIFITILPIVAPPRPSLEKEIIPTCDKGGDEYLIIERESGKQKI